MHLSGSTAGRPAGVGGLAAASGAALDREALRDYLAHSIVTPEATAELQAYVADSFDRFLLTLDLVPPAGEGQRLLEIGANPYFLTLLLKRFRRYDVSLANFFGPGGSDGGQVLVNAKYGETHEFRYAHFNVERKAFPYPDGAFAVVLCCEILEHLVADPVFMLSEIHRVLAPGGRLVLTTPNVHRAQNLLALLRKRNLYDPYSGYGVYGRHNREYTPAEVTDLLTRTGFRVASASTPDTHPFAGPPVRRLLRRALARRGYGEKIFVTAVKAGPFRWVLPEYLYRSLRGPLHVREAYVAMGENDAVQAGDGWHALEDWGARGGPVRWTTGRAEAFLRAAPGRHRLRVEFTPQTLPARRRLAIEAAAEEGASSAACGEISIDVDRAEWQAAETAPLALRGGTLRVTLRVEPTLNPARDLGTADGRDLGVAVRRIELVPVE